MLETSKDQFVKDSANIVLENKKVEAWYKGLKGLLEEDLDVFITCHWADKTSLGSVKVVFDSIPNSELHIYPGCKQMHLLRKGVNGSLCRTFASAEFSFDAIVGGLGDSFPEAEEFRNALLQSKKLSAEKA